MKNQNNEKQAHPAAEQLERLAAQMAEVAASDTENICIVVMTATKMPGTEIDSENSFATQVSGTRGHLISTICTNMSQNDGIATVLMESSLEFAAWKKTQMTDEALAPLPESASDNEPTVEA